MINLMNKINRTPLRADRRTAANSGFVKFRKKILASLDSFSELRKAVAR